MSIPKPPTALNGHCSVVHESTLYVYSPEAFQSIDLTEGAEWKELSSGLGATGAQCVKAVGDNPDNAALFIVGGVPTDTSITNYPGIQKFSFKDQEWEWIEAVDADKVTKNRLNHGATYLNATSQILVYAGSQIAGETGPSSATFLISTNPPYSIQALTSNAPPSVSPILLPWSGSDAVVLGGNEDNRQIYTFGPSEGWQKFGVDLMNGIDQATMQTTVVFGDDGSKVLEIFNMGVSPNVVTRVVLLGKDGQLAPFGQTVGPPPQNTKTKRLEVDDWPDYNATHAPIITRTGFSIATAPNGYAVVSGGNEEDPLCIFDQRENSWVNATALLVGSRADAEDTPTSSVITSATASPTPSASATVEAPAQESSSSKDRMLTVLGATLGTIFGIAAILIIILLLLRWRREKKKRAQGDDHLEKNRLSFADRGGPDLMSNIPAAPRDGPKPWEQHIMNGSNSSLAIITGKTGTGHKRGNGPFGSDASTAGLTMNKGPIGYNDPVEMSRIKEISVDDESFEKEIESSSLAPLPVQSQPPAQKGTSRSSGWSRYFAGNEATNLANMQSQRSTYNSDRLSANSDSKYTDSRVNSQPLQAIAPMDVKYGNQHINHVPTGSPSMGHSQENLSGQQAHLARVGSLHGSVSSVGDDQRTEAWSPIPAPGWQDRPSSSAYTESNRGSALPIQDGASSFFHSEDSSSHHATVRRRDTQDTISALYSSRPNAQEGRESTVTVFPRGIAPMQPTTSNANGENKKNDMSWLNLGAGH